MGFLILVYILAGTITGMSVDAIMETYITTKGPGHWTQVVLAGVFWPLLVTYVVVVYFYNRLTDTD